jgi:hypothetical protein
MTTEIVMRVIASAFLVLLLTVVLLAEAPGQDECDRDLAHERSAASKPSERWRR